MWALLVSQSREVFSCQYYLQTRKPFDVKKRAEKRSVQRKRTKPHLNSRVMSKLFSVFALSIPILSTHLHPVLEGVLQFVQTKKSSALGQWTRVCVRAFSGGRKCVEAPFNGGWREGERERTPRS